MISIPSVLRTYWLALVFVTFDAVLLAVLHERLPDPMPLWWNAAGEPGAWVAGPWGAFVPPLAHLLITAFLVLAPAVDPGALRAREAPAFYPLVVALISCFLTMATGLVFVAALGAGPRFLHALCGAAGLLIAAVGNYLGKVPKNYMIGIRTPWTLCSGYVWERTHRFAAPLFVGGGLALIAHCLLQAGQVSPLFIAATVTLILLSPYCYSFVVWRRITIARAA